MTLRWRPPSFIELFRRTKGKDELSVSEVRAIRDILKQQGKPQAEVREPDLSPAEISFLKELDLAMKTIFDGLYSVQNVLTDETTAKLASLNGLTDPVQLFAVGTSGSAFAISSVDDTHTFNLPNASASAVGTVTTSAQTLGGMKKFAAGLKFNDSIATADADTTPSVANGNLFTIANTGATVITAFDDGAEGQLIILKFSDANTTITASATIKLVGGLNFVSTADDTLTLIRISTAWYECSRSLNA